ncbi:hypothetical protein KKH23_01560 [Patescibacteria group bacterium]|nr:hypothetical protein [Patescibacteria group bacterium]MBU0777178.1 hypothetical protein [Patescibacteria group bacterium]MBU0845873.1 hypothetical protein [Patescibacteria group bacterium]MBU0922900.1 hypothetical protein [Patescibacteria group bacterium]MBU1066367.1 hypothetical protein [Patescibacteria group bacterium]
MNIWVSLIVSVFLIGVGWYFVWTRNAHQPIGINFVVAAIALIYVIAAQKPVVWISLPALWFAGCAIPLLYDSWAWAKLAREQEKMGSEDYY